MEVLERVLLHMSMTGCLSVAVVFLKLYHFKLKPYIEFHMEKR